MISVLQRLPPMLEPLIGREESLDAVRRASADAGLVAVTGPVGVGKTHLALAAAHALLAEGALRTACLCDATGLRETDELEERLVRTLAGERDASLEGVLEAIGPSLLVLDGADALGDAAVAWLAELVRRVPDVTVLLTRRASCPWEKALELAPLAVPEGDAPDGPAAELFAWHARRARPDYGPSPSEAPFVAELLRELDGLPLALVLAAPRLAVMGPAALLHRTKSSRSVLASPKRGSFDDAMESVWQALTASERDALAQLSVLSGFSAEIAEQVVVLEPAAGRVVDVLQRLRERALLSSGPSADELALQVLRGVGDFARRKADPARLAAARERQGACFARLARSALAVGGAALSGASRANMLTVVHLALVAVPGAREAENALWALLALAGEDDAGSTPARFLPLLDRVLEATQGSGANPVLFSRALALRGSARRHAGDIAGATQDLGRAVHVARNLGAKELVGWLETETAHLLADVGQMDAASAMAATAAATLSSVHELAGEARALLCGARIDASRGDHARAGAQLDRAVALAVSAGPTNAAQLESRARRARAEWMLGAGLRDGAREELGRAALAADERERAEQALVSSLCLHDEGSLRLASSGYAECARGARRLGMTSLEGRAQLYGALVSIEQRSLAEAYAELRVASGLLSGELRSLVAALLGAVGRLTVEIRGATSETPACVSPRFAMLARLAAAVPDRASFAHARSAVDRWTGDPLARLVVRALEAALGEGPRLPPPDVLVVAPDGKWFRSPLSEPQSLARRRPLADILAHLARARQDTPGTAVSWEALRDAAWPGERMQATAAAHRVRVALSTLRKLGLRDQLISTAEGYLLDPGCAFVSAEPP